MSPRVPHSVLMVLAVCAATLTPAARAADSATDSLVYIQKGTLPIILTAPHGGAKDVPGAEARKDDSKNRFVVVPDLRTKELALGIAAELEKLLGGKPYIVGSDAHRKYLDPNRGPDGGAYEAEATKAVWEKYHGTARAFVDEVRAKFKYGVLLDIHGQSTYPDNLLRGTRNKETIKALLARAGDKSIVGPDGLFGQLEKNGLQVLPANESPLLKEVSGYTGAYTLQAYGSQNANGIDTFQLEFGKNLRDKGVVNTTAVNAAKAIAAFYKAYIAEPKAKSKGKK